MKPLWLLLPFALPLVCGRAAENSVWQTGCFRWQLSGPLIRTIDERMEVKPANLRFVFQGASEQDYRGSGYGGILWRLGLLEQAR